MLQAQHILLNYKKYIINQYNMYKLLKRKVRKAQQGMPVIQYPQIQNSYKKEDLDILMKPQAPENLLKLDLNNAKDITSQKQQPQQSKPTYDYTDPNLDEVVRRTNILQSKGINPELAFNIAHLSIIENGRKKYYSFGKTANNLQQWANNVQNSLTKGHYKALNSATSYGQFINTLKRLNYNTRPIFYKKEIEAGRGHNLKLVNNYNQRNGFKMVASVDDNIPETDYVDTGITNAKHGGILKWIRIK